MSVIAFTKVALPYGWLGNMSPHPVSLHGHHARTAEALFHVLRLPAGHPSIPVILDLKSPMAAKMHVKRIRSDFVVEPCSEQDVLNMFDILCAKIDQNPELPPMYRANQ